MRSLTSLPLVLILLATAIPLATKAQESGDPGGDSSLELDTIIITGQKAERSLADTDGSVTVVFPGESDGVAGAADDFFGVIERLPNITPFQGDEIAIRGVGKGGFSFAQNNFGFSRGPNDLITTYVDGIPLSTASAPFSFWDVDQIEVLRGAQSILFGRGAVGGVVIIENVDPTFTTEATGQLTIGTEEISRPSFAVSGPIVKDRLAYRIAFDRYRSPSFTDNITTGNDADLKKLLIGRLKLLYVGEGGTELEFSGFSSKINTGGRYVPYVSSIPEEDRIALSDRDDLTSNDAVGASLRGNWPLNDRLSLESSTVWVREQLHRDTDFDLTPAPLQYAIIDNNIRTISQEVRLRYEGSRFDGFAGLYYEDFEGTDTNFISLLGSPINFSQNVRTIAFFGKGRYKISDKLDLTLGIRAENQKTESVSQTRDLAELNLPLRMREVNEDMDFSAFVPKLGLSYKILPETRIYTTVQGGYRAGGSGASVYLGTPYSFDPEKTWNVDLGIRHQSSDSRLRLGANLFYINWYDQQLAVPNPEDIFFRQDMITDNIAQSESYGLESDVEYQVTGNLRIFGSLGLLRTEIKEANEDNVHLIGNSFPSAPKAMVSLGGIYNFDNGLDISLAANWRDSFFVELRNFPENEIDSRFLVDLEVGYRFPDRNLRFDLKITNLFDTYYRNFAQRDPEAVAGYQLYNPESGGAVGAGDGRAVSLTLKNWF
ncbi:TonB-dependent receptor [Candidatus Synechococcus spongiarum]|uniref:TonB-dependent receptor n=1 Tax=Candidatus Synechococcus spongiarum TaxID=431041 RepID=A0A170TF24_9SYNE|nr:TonB-dependent receptor [Candidatus Synechococcus spongiarum]CZB22137.1 hypothetical protein FLM9_1498 [Candidatus Synechococcus spongiarum]